MLGPILSLDQNVDRSRIDSWIRLGISFDFFLDPCQNHFRIHFDPNPGKMLTPNLIEF